MTLNEDGFYMKTLAFDEFQNFLVLFFFHLRLLKCSKNYIKFEQYINRALGLIVLEKIWC